MVFIAKFTSGWIFYLVLNFLFSTRNPLLHNNCPHFVFDFSNFFVFWFSIYLNNPVFQKVKIFGWRKYKNARSKYARMNCALKRASKVSNPNWKSNLISLHTKNSFYLKKKSNWISKNFDDDDGNLITLRHRTQMRNSFRIVLVLYFCFWCCCYLFCFVFLSNVILIIGHVQLRTLGCEWVKRSRLILLMKFWFVFWQWILTNVETKCA